MRKAFAVFATAVLLLAGGGLTGCTWAPPSADANSLAAIKGTWKLASASDEDGPFEPGKASVTLAVNGGKIGGISACNHYFGSVKGTLESLTISQLGQTAVACTDVGIMELEKRYLTALRSANSATLGDVGLVVVGIGVKLTFEPVFDVPAADLVGPRWRLESLVTGLGDNGATSNVSGDGYLQFADNGTVTGNAGCRNLTGSYTKDGTKLTITGLTLAAADCPAEYVDQEEHVVAVLTTSELTIDGDTMTLLQTDAKLGLVYRAV